MYYLKYYKLSLFWLIFLSPFVHQAQLTGGKYPIQNFTPAAYKAGIQNIDFAQNRDMKLFVANNLGVLSFNGHSWKRHDFKSGKKKRSLAFDEETDRLYVGSQGEFGYFEEDWQYTSLIEQIPEAHRDFDEVWDVFIARSHVYFCTFQNIYKYDGGSIEVIGHEDGLERSFLVNGKLLSQTQHGVLLEMTDQDLAPSFPQLQQGQNIAGVIAQDEGYLLFYNSGQIDFTTSFGVSRMYQDLATVLRGTYVNHVLQLADARLAISTQTSGLFLYDMQSGTLERITTQDGLGSNACLRTFQDYYGNLWVGMQNGIAVVHINSPMRLINREAALEGSGYEAYETEAGNYYTTSNGIYFLDKNTGRSIFLPGTEGPAYGIQEIAGRLYAGHHTGLFLLEGGRAEHLVKMEGLWQIKQLRSRPEWAIGGTYAGLYLFRINENRYLEAGQQISGFNLSSRFFEEDQEGNIWVGQYYKGLYKLMLSEDLTQATVVNLSQSSTLPINEQIILGRVEEDMYIATNSGLWNLDPIKGQVVKAEVFSDHIDDQAVYLLGEDRENNVHIIAEDIVGFFRQISADNYQFIPSSLYHLRYHLNNDLLHMSTHTDRGVLFSANEGFIRYDPALESTFKIERPLIISRVFSVSENSVLYSQRPFENRPDDLGSLVIKPRDKVVQIDLEWFQFNNLDTQQFRYLLKGFDEDFGEWTSIATKEYTNLSEGIYEFTAQARNYRGEITTSPPLLLIVKPPFYRSSLAKVLYIFGGLAILLLVFRMQKHRYLERAKRIETDKQLELEQEQQKLLEIEHQKEEELLQLKEEKFQAELQNINNLLAASTMNLVVKNEFIESIKEELKRVKRKGTNEETKQSLERIVKEIDINLRLQEDWEQFEYHFDRVHGDFLMRLRNDYPNLSPNEQKLCTLLRLNLNTKEIANLLSISLRGVEVARYRLRKKLGLKKGVNLSKFILEY